MSESTSSGGSGRVGDPPHDEVKLKRVIGVWGSFAMGYADVGADIYIAIGLIALYALSAAPLALVVAALIYVSIGLCYAELASTYPVAGGAQYFALKAFGDLHGFLAGWGLMLAYTIDIALFSLATVGYLGVVTKIFMNSDLLLQSPYFGLAAIALIGALILLNVIGIRWSSDLNEIFVILDLGTIGIMMALGIPYIIANGSLFDWLGQVQSLGVTPTWESFIYAVSLAMVSYIGIESISQAAEETRHPAKVIPRATKTAIMMVIVGATSLSLLSVTLVSAKTLSQLHSQNPLVEVARNIPFIGAVLWIWVAFTGFFICFASTNTGIIGVSRVTYSMGRFHLSPAVFRRLSKRFRTPYVTIILFSLIAGLIILANVSLTGVDLLGIVASVYSFGALVTYMYVNLSLVFLRWHDPKPRPWKIPLSIRVVKKGQNHEVPILPIFGFVACAFVFSALLLFEANTIAKIIGGFWFLLGFTVYAVFRKRSGLPLHRSKTLT